METLDLLYLELLHRGFIVVNQALTSKDYDWVAREIELLHNVPSLIGEKNLHRHHYFWFAERCGYLAWAEGTGRSDIMSRNATYYQPIWRDMEPIMFALFNDAGISTTGESA